MKLWPDNNVVDLRQEIKDLFYGSLDGPGISRPVLIRRLQDQKCVCWTENSQSAKPGCRYCLGEGFLFTETLEQVYIARNFGSVQNPATVISIQSALAPYGYTDENRCLAFAEYFVFPDYERYSIPTTHKFDALFELKIDENGDLVTPIIRTAKWQVRSVTPHHGDHGRIEYFELGLQKEFQ